MYRSHMSFHRLFPAAALVLAALSVSPLAAQEFIPPDRDRPPQTQPSGGGDTGIRLGIFAFSTRGGYQVNEDNQLVLGSTLDVAELGVPRLRLRPSFEVGFGRAERSLAFNAEVVYRFQDDAAPAIPYLGGGLGYYDDGATEHGWATFVFGFELPYRRTMSWLLEIHTLEGINRARFLIGLATRSPR
jgi:hypothetical protein